MDRFDRNKIIPAILRDGEEEDPRIVAIGGGTGLSTMLRGLKNYTSALTAVVTVADNGGSSGLLREDLHMLPPGDIRNCILALANTEPLMHDLMNYRFGNNHGRLSKQCFGNLFIAAMAGVSGNFYDAVRNISKVLAVKGKVLPVSLEDIHISAVLTDGNTIHGESEIGDRENINEAGIYKVFMEPTDAKPLQEACADIEEADIIVLGPGSLYTSIIPNLLFPEIRDSIQKSRAVKIYVGNIMTQPAETYKYSILNHIEAILRHCMTHSPEGFIEFCIVNNRLLSPELMTEYLLSQSHPVEYNKEEITGLGIDLIEAPLVRITSFGAIRHDHDLLAEIILRLWHHQTQQKKTE
jgi:uncharacterized cofD-like protein